MGLMRKTCSKCGRTRPLDAFYIRGDTGKPRAQCKRCFKDGIMRRTYGITIDEFEEMIVRQDGRCAICHQSPDIVWLKSGKIKGLGLDHNHTTGTNRQLLCDRCNMGIGNFLDSPELLEAAAAYLRDHESRATAANGNELGLGSLTSAFTDW